MLRRVARAALYASWRGAAPDAARFCAAQYNKILARLRQLEPSVEQLFAPLAEGASPAVTRMAARELAAYFEDEEEGPAGVFEGRGAGERGAWAWAWAGHRGRCGGRRGRGWAWAASPACGPRR